MSSTIVYQGSQSCFESQNNENKSLRLKLAAPKSKNTENRDSGGWNFLESLSNCSKSPKKTFNAESFHPSLKLSQKSLELCTENLGSETGSDDTGDIDILSFTSTKSRTAGHVSLAKKANTRSFPPPFTTSLAKKANTRSFPPPLTTSLAKKANTRSFPPPLTTISGSNSIQVRPHREGGRLIIEAVEAPSSRACFEAERSHGRLQLRFLKNCEFFYDRKMSSKINEDDNIGESETEDHNTIEQQDIFEEDEFEKNSANNNIVDQERNGGYMKEDMDENFQRHNNSRCKESGHGNNNKGLCNWEAFLVAT